MMQTDSPAHRATPTATELAADLAALRVGLVIGLCSVVMVLAVRCAPAALDWATRWLAGGHW
jgi:hypothetical protein